LTVVALSLACHGRCEQGGRHRSNSRFHEILHEGNLTSNRRLEVFAPESNLGDAAK
jgi:hypothetical protein